MELVWPVRQTLPAMSMTVALPEAAGKSGAAKSRAAKMGPDCMQIPDQRAMGHGIGKIAVRGAGCEACRLIGVSRIHTLLGRRRYGFTGNRDSGVPKTG